MPHHITLIAGDGIGPEVARATQEVIAAAGVDVAWDAQPAGLGAVTSHGSALPEATLTSIRQNQVALKGPTTTPVGTGHTSANVAMRRKLDLFASVRPVKSVPGITTRYDNVDLVIFRENTEGLYAGLEHEVARGCVVSMKVVTEAATRRIAEAAFAFAAAHGRKRVTVVHKANILKLGDGFFLDLCRQVAAKHPQTPQDDCIIDAMCMRMVQKPEQFDLLVMENLYGDIMSDLCAGLVGGLGIVPGANIGEKVAIFEAVHGAAPDIAGQGVANPTALIKSAALMLAHLGEHAAAETIEGALARVFARGEVRTRDLGGRANTQTFTAAVIAAL